MSESLAGWFMGITEDNRMHVESLSRRVHYYFDMKDATDEQRKDLELHFNHLVSFPIAVNYHLIGDVLVYESHTWPKASSAWKKTHA